MAEISLCMIVKNEEKVLARCLDSVKDLVDEIIIADTGSTDRTKDIAREYTPYVFDFEWIDDFSAARNFSFSKAKKEFIMWLDADDVITEENRAKFIELKRNLDNTDAVMMRYNTAFDEDKKPTFSYFRERIIRRTSFCSWRGKVHEVIEYTGNTIHSDTAINHHSIKSEYSTRNLDIYEKQANSNETMQPRDIFYYGRELYYHKKYDRAIEILSDFLDNKNAWIENKIEACKILSFCYLETGETDKALDVLFKSLRFDKPRAEICCNAGNIFIEKGQYEQAIYWFESALNLNPEMEKGCFTDINAYGYIPCLQLCVCYDKLKDYKKAAEYNKKAGEYRPNSQAVIQNFKYFEGLKQRRVEPNSLTLTAYPE